MAFNHPSGPRCRWEDQGQGGASCPASMSFVPCEDTVRQWVTQLGAAWRSYLLLVLFVMVFFVWSFFNSLFFKLMLN